MMEAGADVGGILKAIHDSMAYGSIVGLMPSLHPWVAWMAETLKQRIPFDDIRDYINTHITNRRKGRAVNTNQSTDFLTKLLELQETANLSDLNLFTTLGANIAAGSDTTAISLGSVVYHLMKNPAVKAKLCAEIDQLDAEGKISNPVTYKEAQGMPYLQAIIKEALRLHPATGQMLSRVVGPGGATLGGYYFPAGVSIQTQHIISNNS